MDLSIAAKPSSVKVILCGARGSGKSTELTRLAREVGEDFCVVHTDLAAGLPDQAGSLAVLILLGAAGLHAIRSWSDEPEPLTQNRAKNLQVALGKFGDAMPKLADLLTGAAQVVTVFDPVAGAAMATTAALTKSADSAVRSVAPALKHTLARGPLEGRLADDQRDNAMAVVSAVNDILADLAKLAGRPPLLLADGLDKRTGVEEVELALSDEYLLHALDAPLILTGPVNLRHDARFRAVPGNFRLSLLYNIPVCERSADLPNMEVRRAQPGIDLLRNLYERRRIEASIPTDLLAANLVEVAAHMSSGIVREFLGLLHGTCKNALISGRRNVSIEDLEATLKARRLELQGYLNEQHVKILRRVLDKGIVPGGPEADVLLFENFIACYPNGNVWFRPHELIAEYIENQSVDE